MAGRILVEGSNCWRVRRAMRAATLIDAAAYYAAFVDAAARAQRSILMLGWDFDSRVELLRPAPAAGRVTLGTFLDGLVAATPGLEVHVLEWDYNVLFTLERELLHSVSWSLRTHPRVHFRLDDAHPTGAAHHQKVVVIDDRVAFCGGLDFTQARWDTPEHRAADPRRVDGDGEPYAPFHDVQMIVDGEVAHSLGELARARWWRSGGRPIAPPEDLGPTHDPWPTSVTPDLREVDIAIARTQPAYGGEAGAREIERLYRDAITAARRHLYVESQYLTSASICEAMAARLREPEGPEIVLVLPRVASGWLEESTMGVLRGRVLDDLWRADLHHRLRTFTPVVPGLAGEGVNVHAKVLVVDDRLARVGSSNLSNRSMGFDTECDLAFEGTSDETRAAVRGLRHRLLGEHLGVAPARVAEAEATAGGSLIAAIDALRAGERTLVALERRQSELDVEIIANAALVDPVGPVDTDLLLGTLVPPERAPPTRRSMWRAVALITTLVAVAALWRWTPLASWLDPETLRTFFAPVRESPWGPLIALGAFIAGGLVGFPVTLLIFQTALIFGPWVGWIYAYVGAAVSASITYGLGRLLGRDVARRLAGPRLRAVVDRLGRSGVITIATIRLLPLAPFGVINVVAGASHVRYRPFILGTMIGMSPGIFALNAFGTSLATAITEQDPASIVLTCLLGAGLVAAALWLRRRLTRRVPVHQQPLESGA